MLIGMVTNLLAGIAVIVLVLQNTARIPAALTEFLNACQPLVYAARELAALLRLSATSDAGASAGTDAAQHVDHDRCQAPPRKDTPHAGVAVR